MKNVGLHTIPYLKWNQTNAPYYKLEDVIAYSIKRWKRQYEGNSAFQTVAIFLYKQPLKKNT